MSDGSNGAPMPENSISINSESQLRTILIDMQGKDKRDQRKLTRQLLDAAKTLFHDNLSNKPSLVTTAAMRVAVLSGKKTKIRQTALHLATDALCKATEQVRENGGPAQGDSLLTLRPSMSEAQWRIVTQPLTKVLNRCAEQGGTVKFKVGEAESLRKSLLTKARVAAHGSTAVQRSGSRILPNVDSVLRNARIPRIRFGK